MAADDDVVERELKVQVDRAFVLPAFEGFDELSDETVELHAAYWDTADHRLAERGHTLRHRRSVDGTEHRWTVKLSSRGSRFAVRREINLPPSSATPPAAALAVIRGLVGHAPVVPVAELTTVRRRRRLQHRSSGAVIELADDDLTSTVDGAPGPAFREIEVEVVDGDDEVLGLAAKLLRRAGAGAADPTPKLLRVLSTGTDSEAANEGAAVTVRQLVGHAIAVSTDQLLAHDPAIRLDADPEDIHKARVATRRLRSDLKTLEPWCDPFRVEGLRRELQWLGGVLGTVRDADVMANTLAARAEQIDDLDPVATRSLLDLLAEDRRRAVVTLLDVMGSSRYLGLVADLRALAHEPPLRADADGGAPAVPAARWATARAFDRVTKRVKRLPDNPPMEQLHEIRKAAKRARYAAELVSAISHGRTDRVAERLAELQDELGATQDAVTAHHWLTTRPFTAVDPAVVFTAGRLAQSFADEVRRTPTGWRSTWKKASAPKRQRWFR